MTARSYQRKAVTKYCISTMYRPYLARKAHSIASEPLCMANQEALALGVGEHESSLGDQRQKSTTSMRCSVTLEGCMRTPGWHLSGIFTAEVLSLSKLLGQPDSTAAGSALAGRQHTAWPAGLPQVIGEAFIRRAQPGR